MARIFRCFPLTLVIVALLLPGAPTAMSPQAQQQAQAVQQAEPPTPPPAPPARTMTPEQKAYSEALAMADPAKRLEALRKFQADYPNHSLVRSAESAIFGVLLTSFKDREAEIAASLDKQLGSIPPTTTPDTRLAQLVPTLTRLVDANLLMARAESLLDEALSKLDREAYIKTRREAAERSRKLAEDRMKNAPTPPAQPPSLPMIPSDAMLGQQFDRTQASALELKGRIHLAAGDTARAESALKAAFAANPALTRAPLELSKMALARGDERAALDYQIPLALGGRMKRAEEAEFAALYRKVHGASANVDAELDRLYREKYPNPIAHPEPFKGPRSGRVALLEMFTGSGCGPCVSADLALDAALDRYPEDAIAVLAYHVHIPAPDPMTVPGSDVRKTLYAVPGVPTFNVDGGRARLGGGSRENTEMTYSAYVPVIDKALNTPADADLRLAATVAGSRITVKATVANVRSTSKDLRVHFVLAERHLTFLGENGIRFHPFVVRDVAGDNAGGYPLADLSGPATLEHTFDLDAIPGTITKSLADDIARRRKTESASAPPREYRAEGHAMTAIDPGQLVIVAFVQDATNSTSAPAPRPAPAAGAPVVVSLPAQAPAPTYKVLQAAWIPVAAPAARKQ